MLKRLELVGFKSFADKTEFEFAKGITAIVGPNGSGKSNVVDAVRWILGEQSAKSLRGGEMADVIFNGSTSRRSLGMAEVTMTFDNSRQTLTGGGAEVQITRRVYRSGEGEYLINQQVCRLKDIKDLFLGTGAGADAYCVIEQGKVDGLLQASTRERRTIFEEAAGISRFKAKKIETLRKLERVDQNLQRLRDIIDEVEKQLRSVKLQAAKAQRYQEYSLRLKELRIALGLKEYHELTERLGAETGVLDRLRERLREQETEAESREADTRRLEESLAGLEETWREQEAHLASARQQIAAEETTLNREWSLSGDLEKDLAATRERKSELDQRVSSLADAAARLTAELQEAELQDHEQRRRADSLEEALSALVHRMADLQSQLQNGKGEHMELMRQAARLHNDAVSFQAQVDHLRRERERLRQRAAHAAETLASLDVELEELARADEQLQARLAASRQTLADQRQERERLRRLRDDTAQAVSDLRARRSGLASRIDVLEGLERSHEGLGSGVREVLALLESGDGAEPKTQTPWSRDLIPGIVADFLTVRREYAPLMDIALGDKAQRFLVRDAGRLAEALGRMDQPFSGRVSFWPVTEAPGASSAADSKDKETRRPGDKERWAGEMAVPAPIEGPGPASSTVPVEHPDIVADALDLVNCEHPEFGVLPGRLFERTLVVRDLNAARALSGARPGFRFVTLAGELLEADGTLTAGAHHAEAGILSRKSELRELRLQAAETDQRIAVSEQELAGLGERLATLERQEARLEEETQVLAEQAADLRSRLGQRRQHREGLHEEVSLGRREISGVEQEIESLDQAWQQARRQAEEADQKVHAVQTRLEEADREVRGHERERQERQTEVTAAKVALAQTQERLTAFQVRNRQVLADLEERRGERGQAERHLESAQARLNESQRNMLRASSVLAQAYLEKEAAQERVADLGRQRELRRQERQSLAERAQGARDEWKSRQEEAHVRELEANDIQHRRNSLADRLREDYQIELAEMYREARSEKREASTEGQGARGEGQESGGDSETDHSPLTTHDSLSTQHSALSTDSLDVVVATEEIAELRRKLGRLGSVNLDSLQELSELEGRASNLKTQSDDLVAAKSSLEEIIATINQDSRRLFMETFTAVRTHFQELFRKLFGGGVADVVLEDENDVLESGIEVIARPPGKELTSISLMSGGEKTLTAVALLLGIFRSKPSPFCILDEVDAALDEANIGRFTAVLHDFLDQSQFIIITHSKKTMAVADVLYGITMQESGVSKRVAVRFEDWVEDKQAFATPEPALADRNGA